MGCMARKRRRPTCAISACLNVAEPSRHRRDSCPSHDDVGGFFFDFEAVRTASSNLRSAQDQCIVNSDSESAIEDCLKLTKQFEIVDVPPLSELTAEVRGARVEKQLETLASEKNPLAAPIHLEYYALLALVVVLYVDILDVAGIVARFQH